MRTWKEVRALARSSADERVLSVYFERDTTDPGVRSAWKKRLAAAAEAARGSIEDEADTGLFDAALRHVESETDSLGRVLPSPGWVAFATADGTLHSGGLLHSPPDVVRWGRGLSLGPYLPSVTSDEAMAVVLLDQRVARLFTYRPGALTELDSVSAGLERDGDVESGVAKRASTSSGVRGETRTDAAKSARAAAELHFLQAVADRVLSLDGTDAVAVGGAKKPASALRRVLEAAAQGTSIVDLPGIAVADSPDAIQPAVDAARRGSRLLRQADLLDLALGSRSGNGVGWNNVQRAFQSGAVDTLLISEGLLRSPEGDIDQLVTLAAQRAAEIEVLREDVGARLEREGGGIAATLRFVTGEPG